MTDPIELANQPQPSVPAGWYPDAERPGAMRYWNGAMWTEHRTGAVYGTAKGASGMAVAALICGIIGSAFLLAPVIAYPIPLALGLAAIVLGLIGKGSIGYWGVGLGAVALIAGIAGFASVNNTVNDASNITDNANQQIQQSIRQANRQLNRQLHPGVPRCHDRAAIARYHAAHPFARNIQCAP
jgi:hypothetical protein